MDFSHFHENGVDRVSGSSLEASVSRVGAELIGLTWRRADGADIEVLWRNGIIDPPQDGRWRRHAPILFPIVGGIHGNRSMTTGGDQVRFDGLHGFLRNREMNLAGVSPDGTGLSLRYELRADDATREMYPWDFAVTVEYVFKADGVGQSITVANIGTRDMPYQVGWHPGFNLPLSSGVKKDCRVRLPRGPVQRLGNDENCHLTGEAVAFDTAGDFLFSERELELTYMFDVAGVAPVDRFVDLLDPDGSVGVRVGFPDYPHLGVWSDAGAPFICVEPWQGMDDSVAREPFDRKFGMVMLRPGASETRRATISFLSGQEMHR